MSTKTTYKYASIKKFTLHLYNDFAKQPALEVNTSSVKLKIPLTDKELETVNKQLNNQISDLYLSLCYEYGKTKIWALKTDDLIDLIEKYLKKWK